MNDDTTSNGPRSGEEMKAPEMTPRAAPPENPEGVPEATIIEERTAPSGNRPMYGDFSANKLAEAQGKLANEPSFLEKHELGANPAAKTDDLKVAHHETNVAYLAEELKEKSIQNIEKAASAPPEEKPKVNAADFLHDSSKPLKPLRTFQGDAAELMQKKQASVISIKVAEEEKYRKDVKEGKAAPRPEKKNEEIKVQSRGPSAYGIKAMTLFLSLLLILVGVSTLFVFNYLIKERAPVSISYTTFIPYDFRETVDVTNANRETLTNTFRDLRSAVVDEADVITYVKLTERKDGAGITGEGEEISTGRFLELYEVDAPEHLIRALSDNFMAGLYSTTRKNPFFVIKVSSFDNAFSGMLSFERTLAGELGQLFTDEPFKEAGASTTTPDGSQDEGRAREASAFEDILVRNIDTRALRTAEGNIGMLYSFIDHETLLITSDQSAFEGIVDKIRAAQLVR